MATRDYRMERSDQISAAMPGVGAPQDQLQPYLRRRGDQSPAATSSTEDEDASGGDRAQWKNEAGVNDGELVSEAADSDSDLELGQAGYGHAIVELTLRVGRYVAVVVLGLGVAVIYAAVSQKGVDLEHGVRDAIRSSDNAEEAQDKYNAITGNLLIAISKVFEFYCEALIFPTLITYLLNCSLFPGDQPHRFRSPVKHTTLFWAFRVILILINVGTASIFVGYRATNVDRYIASADLTSGSTNESVSTFVSAEVGASSASGIDVRNTILRSVVDGYTRPYGVDSNCGAANSLNQVPPSTFASTSVVLGFPQNEWSAEFLQQGLQPTFALNFTYSDFKDRSSELEAQLSGNMDIKVAYELFVQGKVIFERGFADLHLSNLYDCDATDGTFIPSPLDSISSDGSENASASSGSSSDTVGVSGSSSGNGSGARSRQRKLEDLTSSSSAYAGWTEGSLLCQGSTSTIAWLQYLLEPNNLTWPNLLAEEVSGINDTYTDAMDTDGFVFGFATYSVTPEMTLEVATIDIPLDQEGGFLSYQLTNDTFQLDPANCGADSCIAVSDTYQTEFRQELTLTSYVTDCDVAHLEYDTSLLNFFPRNCIQQDNSVMLYGLGTYMTAEEFSTSDEGYPQLVSPRAFLTLSFARLAWEYTDLAEKYGAECVSDSAGAEDACVGLAVPSNSSDTYEGVILVGRDSLPDVNVSFTQPLRLLGLNQAILPDLERKLVYQYYPNYINRANVASGVTASNNTEVWNSQTCDSMFDAYIHYIEDNHFVLDRPLQPMYTTALYYLLQNGVSTSVNKTDTSVSPTGRLLVSGTGSLEKKIIAFKIPAVSAAIAFVGCAVLLLLLFFVLQFPTDRVKRSPNTTPAAQYVAISTDNEMYPELVHKKWLRFPETGDVLQMDDYVVDSIVLHAKKDASKKIYL